MAGFAPQYLQVSFVSPVTVRGHTEYILQVSLSGKTWQCQRRYRQFNELHAALKSANASLPMPRLPEKKWFGNMRPGFVQERQAGLQDYVDKLLLDSRWASMQMLRAFFDTHRHMSGEVGNGPGGDAAQGGASKGGGGAAGRSAAGGEVNGEAAGTSSEASQDRARMEAGAREQAEERRNAVVEHAEDLMVEIYAAPPVIDQTSAAEQVLGVEEALGRRAEDVRASIVAYREDLARVIQGGNDDGKATMEGVAGDDEEQNNGGTEVGHVPIVTQEDRDSLCAQAQELVENFQMVEN